MKYLTANTFVSSHRNLGWRHVAQVLMLASFAAAAGGGQKKPPAPAAVPAVVAPAPADQPSIDPERKVMSPLDVKDADIQDVIRTISKGYNLNIVLDKEVTGKVTVHLSDVPVIEGLRTLARSNGYDVIKEGNVYRIRKAADEQRSIISFFRGKLTVDVQNIEVKDLLKEISVKTATSIVPDSKVQGKITGKLYQVDLDDGLRALLEGNGFEINKRKNIYQVSMGNDAGPSGVQPNMGRYAMRNTGTSNFYIDLTAGRLTLDVSNGNLQDVLKAIAQKSDLQIVTYGNIMGEINAKLRDIPLTQALALILGGTMFTFVQKDSIILIGDRNAATPAGQALSKSELIQLKCIKADGVMQVLPKDISPSNVRVIKEQNALLVSGTSEDIVSMREFVNTIDIPTPQVSIDAVIVEYSEGIQKDFGINYWLHNTENSSKSYKTIPSPTTQLGAGSNAVESGFSGAGLKKFIADLNGWTSFAGRENTLIGKLPDDFFAVIRFLESQNKANVLAKPSIVTLNGNKASINVNETRYFKVSTGSAVLGSDYSIRFQPITFGIKLDITPWISQGGQITAEIAPEVSNSDGSNPEGGYPNVSTRTISTTVRLNDGETIILGGLIKTNASENRDKIPILGDIPLIGNLFRHTTKSFSKTNLVVYITPHIIKKGSVNLDSALQSLEINNADFLDKKLRGIFKKSTPSREAAPVAEPDTSSQKTRLQTSDKMGVPYKAPSSERPGADPVDNEKDLTQEENSPGSVFQNDTLHRGPPVAPEQRNSQKQLQQHLNNQPDKTSDKAP
jgi:type IV pilus assembly protein PilQ